MSLAFFKINSKKISNLTIKFNVDFHADCMFQVLFYLSCFTKEINVVSIIQDILVGNWE